MRERRRRLRNPFDQGDRVRGDALARAGEAEALLGRRLDADAVHVHVHALRQIAAHLRDVRRDLAEIEKESAEVKLADCRTGFFGTMYSAVLRLVAPLC